jgi:hypothetical protein
MSLGLDPSRILAANVPPLDINLLKNGESAIEPPLMYLLPNATSFPSLRTLRNIGIARGS